MDSFQAPYPLKTRSAAAMGYLALLPRTQPNEAMHRERALDCAWCTLMFSLMVAAVFAVIYGFFVLAGVVAANAQAQSAEALFQQAQRLERTSGDYAAAIEAYRSVYQHPSASRDLEAKALLHMGLAYENLGRSEAQKTFETLLADYADIEEVLEAARMGIARANALGHGSNWVQFVDNRAIIDPTDKFSIWGASLSPSGKQIVAMSPDLLAPLLLDMQTGESKLFGPNDGTWGYGAFARLSPEGDRIAFSYWIDDDQLARIRLVDVKSGSEDEVIDPTTFIEETIGAKVGRSQVEIHDWSDDGGQLLVVLWWRPANDVPGEEDQMMVSWPLDGSSPTIVVDRETMWEYSWGKSCFSGMNRFVMAEFVGSENEAVQEIRRIDLKTGEMKPWRSSKGRSFGLLACANAVDEVIYNSKMLSSNNAFSGDPGIAGDGNLDPLLFRMSEEQYGLLGSRFGDVSLLETGYKNNFDFLSVARGSHTLGEKLSKTADGWIFGWDWSSDGTKIIYSQNGRKLGIADRDDWTLTDFGFEEQMIRPRWLADQRHVMAMSPASEDGVYKVFIVDTEQKDIVESWPSSEVSNISSFYHYPASVLTSDMEQGCINRGRLGEANPAPLACVGHEALKWISPRYSPDGRHIRLFYLTADSTRTLAVTAADGSGFRILLEEPDAGNALVISTADWGPNDEIMVGRSNPDNWNQGVLSIETVNIHTGSVTRVFEPLQNVARIREFEYSPDGEVLGVAYSTLEEQATTRLTIIRNALAQR